MRTPVRCGMSFCVSRLLSMGLYVIPAGGDDPQSPHNEDEIYYIVSGRGKLTAGDQEFAAQPGSILFVAKQVPYKFHSVTRSYGCWCSSRQHT